MFKSIGDCKGINRRRIPARKKEIRIEVAAICVTLRIDSPQCLNYIHKEYGRFISKKEPFLYLDINIAEKINLDSPSQTDITVSENEIEINNEYILGKVDIALGKGIAILNSKDVKMGMDILLRNIFTIMLIKKYNGIALHATGILKDGKVYIFAGPSKNGKTTVSRISLSCGYTVLSDDLVMIRRIDNNYFVFPTPSWSHIQEGKIENRPYPIGGIFRLKKDDKIYLENISQGIAIAEILTVLGVPQQFLPAPLLLNRFYDIIKNNTFYVLHFKKDQSFWDCIK